MDQRIYIAVSVSPIRDSRGAGGRRLLDQAGRDRAEAGGGSAGAEPGTPSPRAQCRPDGYLAVERRHQYLAWDEGLRRLYGVGAGPPVTQYEQFLDRVHPDDREFVAASIQRALEGGGALDYEFRIVLPDGGCGGWPIRAV